MKKLVILLLLISGCTPRAQKEIKNAAMLDSNTSKIK